MVLNLLLISLLAASVATQDICRFAKQYSRSELEDLADSRKEFLKDVYKREARFVREIAVDARSGLTLDGWQLDAVNGSTFKPHKFSAPSKESVHIALLGLVLDGAEDASAFYTI